MPPSDQHPRWIVVVPVKGTPRAKTRLDVPGVDHAALARAIALDTLDAVLGCGQVAELVVVSDDPGLARAVTPSGRVRFVPEDDAAGLNAAIASGVDAVDPDARMPRAALLGDIPSLRPRDLGRALDAAAHVSRAVVPDAEETGTTLLTAMPGTPWRSSFGTGSFARHRDQGFAPLEIPLSSSLRHDVDTADQLDVARSFGLGPRSAALVG